jgi:hypothetical protein
LGLKRLLLPDQVAQAAGVERDEGVEKDAGVERDAEVGRDAGEESGAVAPS